MSCAHTGKTLPQADRRTPNRWLRADVSNATLSHP